jgi:5-deoxy-glucuronate isomerase
MPSKLVVRPSEPDADGRIVSVTPEHAKKTGPGCEKWAYVGFDMHKLKAGQSLKRSTGSVEHCLVFVTGGGEVKVGEQTFKLEHRDNPFDAKAPGAVYVPYKSEWEVVASTDAELAICNAPGGGNHKPRQIPGDKMSQEVRGKGTNTRYVRNILPDNDPDCNSLLVVEVVTPAGNSSSYPPHKHDTDSATETALEETYYHRIDPPQGFGFQRCYTDDGSLDEACCVQNGDVVMIPKATIRVSPRMRTTCIT